MTSSVRRTTTARRAVAALTVAITAALGAGDLRSAADPASDGPRVAGHRSASCPWMAPGQSPRRRARELLAAMTTTQKIAELYGRGAARQPGAADVIPAVPALCIPRLVYNDAGAGVGDTQSGTTAFPDEIAQAASWDPALQRRTGAAIGRQAWRKGIDVQLAPGLDIARSPLGGRNFEYAGEDPFLTGRVGAAIVRGIQSQHVVAVAKHFALNDQETHRMADSANVDARTMQEIDLPAFQAAIDAGVGSVMCGYNRINEVYACQNRYLLRTVLDSQFGFRGWVMSDWNGTHSTIAAADHGLDEEHNATPSTYFAPDRMGPALRSGAVSSARLDDMMFRKLFELFRVGVFDHPPPQRAAADVDTARQRSLAARVAEAGSVLLKNADGVLPLGGPGKTIAVIGRPAGETGAQAAYQGGGSSRVPEAGPNPNVVTPLAGITARALSAGDVVIYADGTSTAAAARVAARADVAVVFASAGATEAADRTSLHLDDASCDFVCTTPPGPTPNEVISAVAAANPHTVVVLQTGAPVAMPWLPQVRGVLETWFPGQADGTAAAAVLFGDVDPSGKVPYTFPRRVGDGPVYRPRQFPGVLNRNGVPQSYYTERLLVGYRWFQSQHVRPLFPFGFGLSYTSFRFSDLRVTPRGAGAVARVTVTNTGTRTGAEVAQLYVADPAVAGEPPHQLKGFARISLRPGESGTVRMALDSRAFAIWRTRPDGAGSWFVTPGCYGIDVGDSSASLPLHAGLARAGGRCAS